MILIFNVLLTLGFIGFSHIWCNCVLIGFRVAFMAFIFKKSSKIKFFGLHADEKFVDSDFFLIANEGLLGFVLYFLLDWDHVHFKLRLFFAVLLPLGVNLVKGQAFKWDGPNRFKFVKVVRSDSCIPERNLINLLERVMVYVLVKFINKFFLRLHFY